MLRLHQSNQSRKITDKAKENKETSTDRFTVKWKLDGKGHYKFVVKDGLTSMLTEWEMVYTWLSFQTNRSVEEIRSMSFERFLILIKIAEKIQEQKEEAAKAK